MKRFLALALLVGLCAAEGWSALKVGSLVRFDNTVAIDTNYANNIVDKGGAFNVSRFYVDVMGDIAKDVFGNAISGRFTYDASPAVNLVKLAYLDYKFMNELQLTIGVQWVQFAGLTHPVSFAFWSQPQLRTGFGISSDVDLGLRLWGNLSPQEFLMDKEVTKIQTNTTDAGSEVVSVKQTVTTTNKYSMMQYNLQVLNGEGYKTIFAPSATNANNYALCGSFWVTPVYGLSAALSGRWQEKSSTSSSSDLGYALVVAAKDTLGNPVESELEFVGRMVTPVGATNSVNSMTVGANFAWGLFDKMLFPGIEFDYMDANLDPAATNDTQMIVSAALKFQPAKTGISIQPYLSYWLVNKASAGDIDAGIRFEYSAYLDIK